MKQYLAVILCWAAVTVSWGQQYTISTLAGGAPPPTPIPAANASVGSVLSVATDAAGNLYFSSDLNCVFKVNTRSILTRVAGTCRQGGDLGDGGPASSAQLFGPRGIAVDAGGNLYIADIYNNRIRKVSPAGIITSVAGSGGYGYSGDGGLATSAQLANPVGVAVDAAGNLYIADSGNYRIRKVSPTGIISTVAGNGSYGYSGDGGPATSAQLRHAAGLALDAAGNVYVADAESSFFGIIGGRVRKVSPAGIITTVAGNGVSGYSGDGGIAINAQFSGVYGVAVDAAGNLYIADSGNARIRKVSPAGIISTVAGNGSYGYSGDGGFAASAQLDLPYGVAVDMAGSLYIADSGTIFGRSGRRVRKVSPSGIITTVAGNGSYSYSGDDGLATSAQIGRPGGVAIDAVSNLYIADVSNDRIRRVSPGGIITTVAGNGGYGYSGDGGLATNAQLNQPRSVAVDATGNLYIADSGNARIRKVSPAGIISTVAGNGGYGYSGDGGLATSAQIGNPASVAVDVIGNLYIADTFNYRIRKVSPAGMITTVAGNGSYGYSGDGGPATSAQLGGLEGIAVDSSGNLYVADTGNYRIRKVSTSGIISTVAGNGSYGFFGDGGLSTDAQLAYPSGVAVDTVGNLYIADSDNYRIRKVSRAGLITTIAGNGGIGDYGDGGLATVAALGQLSSVAVDGNGKIYVADTSHRTIRLLQPVPTITRGDVNGDNRPDLIWQNDTTRQVSVWYLGGTRGNTFLSDSWLDSSGQLGWTVVATGDFNEDGKLDLVWQNDSTRQVAVWYLGGAQGNMFLSTTWLAANGPLGWRVVCSTDLNGDGKPDLLWQHDTTRQVSVWYLGGAQGNTFLSDAWLAPNGAPGWRVVGTADFNSDGKPDLIWQHDTTRQVSVWYLGGAQGNTFLSDAWLSSTPAPGWTVVGTADFNSDGTPDLIWQNDSTRQVSVWYLGGAQGNTFLGDAWLSANGAPGWRPIAH